MDKRLYILIPLVVIIWGLIIYKAVDALSTEPVVVENQIQDTPKASSPKKERILHLNYSDPFLGTTPQKQVVKAKPVSKRQPKIAERKRKKQEPKVSLPKLRYNGMVENHGSGSERHLVAVNGSTRIVTIGEDIDGVKLEKVYADSVLFTWNSEKIFIRK